MILVLALCPEGRDALAEAASWRRAADAADPTDLNLDEPGWPHRALLAFYAAQGV